MNETTNRNGLTLPAIHARRTVLKGAGAALAGLALTAANPRAAGRAFASEMLDAGDLTDVDILNFALTLEHLEAEFYKQVVSSGQLSGDVLRYVTTIRDHEIAHVDFLTTALGSAAVGKLDNYNFAALGDLNSQAGILAVAQKLEETGVGAYTGAAALIDNKDYLAAAASIEQVEARHAATIRLLQNGQAAPKAYGPVLTVDQVNAAIAPIVGG
jgi:rubrerythrin